MSKAEARGVTVTLVDYIKDELLKGNGIKIEGLGTFSIRIQSEGSETSEEVTVANVKNVVIDFRADKTLREEVRKIRFEKVKFKTPADGSFFLMKREKLLCCSGKQSRKKVGC